MKFLLLALLLCLLGSSSHAQWTKQDSIWLQNVLAGKDTIKLNPEFQEAIRNGTLINTEAIPTGEQKMASPSSIPITKDFSNYVQKDNTNRRKVPLKDLPPGVFWRHNPPTRNLPYIHESIREELRRNPPSNPKVLASIDVASMTSKKESTKKRNAKNAKSWKIYRNLPTPDVLSKKKAFERQQAEAAQKKDTISVSTQKKTIVLPTDTLSTKK